MKTERLSVDLPTKLKRDYRKKCVAYGEDMSRLTRGLVELFLDDPYYIGAKLLNLKNNKRGKK